MAVPCDGILGTLTAKGHGFLNKRLLVRMSLLGDFEVFELKGFTRGKRAWKGQKG
jgi:hypothetical protein